MSDEPGERTALLGGSRLRVKISEAANTPRGELSRGNSHLGSQLPLPSLRSDNHG